MNILSLSSPLSSLTLLSPPPLNLSPSLTTTTKSFTIEENCRLRQETGKVFEFRRDPYSPLMADAPLQDAVAVWFPCVLSCPCPSLSCCLFLSCSVSHSLLTHTHSLYPSIFSFNPDIPPRSSPHSCCGRSASHHRRALPAGSHTFPCCWHHTHGAFGTATHLPHTHTHPQTHFHTEP